MAKHKKHRVYKGFFDGEWIFNATDADGYPPGLRFLMSTERGPGKSTQVSKRCIQRAIENNEQFVLYVRQAKELGHSARGILKSYTESPINEYKGIRIEEEVQTDGVYSNIYAVRKVDDEEVKQHIGYCIALINAEKIKNISNEFCYVDRIFFDEFLPINKRKYLPGEIDLFEAANLSIMRGQGQKERYVEIYLVANTITMGNPYFEAYGDLNKKVQSSTWRYRGKGVVYERVEVDGLADEHANSPFGRAYSEHRRKAESNIWIMDDNSLVAKPDGWGHGTYCYTIQYNGIKFGVLNYYARGITYFSRKVDKYCKDIYNTTKEGSLDLPMIKKSPVFKNLRERFYEGNVRCQDGGLQRIAIDIFG